MDASTCPLISEIDKKFKEKICDYFVHYFQ